MEVLCIICSAILGFAMSQALCHLAVKHEREREATFFEPVNWVWDEKKAAMRRATKRCSEEIKAKP